jgi:hypothetical protein
MLPLALKERRKLCGSETKMLKKISGPEKDEGTFMIQTGHVEVSIRKVKSTLEFRSQSIS